MDVFLLKHSVHVYLNVTLDNVIRHLYIFALMCAGIKEATVGMGNHRMPRTSRRATVSINGVLKKLNFSPFLCVYKWNGMFFLRRLVLPVTLLCPSTQSNFTVATGQRS